MTTLRTALAAATVIVAAASTTTADPKKHSAELPDEPKAPERAELGAPAPDFALTDTEGKEHHLAEYTKAGNVVVLEWFNPDCPFVKKHHEKHKSMASTFAKYGEKEVVWLAVNSGAPGKQGYGLERNAKARESYGIKYPVLLDEDGKVGRTYEAKTTPQMYVISDGILVYRGALDENRSAGKLGDENYVADALDCVLAGKPVDKAETKSYGCTVKYAKK